MYTLLPSVLACASLKVLQSELQFLTDCHIQMGRAFLQWKFEAAFGRWMDYMQAAAHIQSWYRVQKMFYEFRMYRKERKLQVMNARFKRRIAMQVLLFYLRFGCLLS